MGSQTPRRREGSDKLRVPPAEQSPHRVERSTPLHEEGLGKPPRQPGQVDIRRLPGSSMQQ